MDRDERHKVCELIAAMIAADGVVEAAEAELLRSIVNRFGLPERDTTTELAGDLGRSTQVLRSLPAEARPKVMALLVEAAIVDGYVDPKERALLLASAAALGIDAISLEERITVRLSSRPPPSP